MDGRGGVAPEIGNPVFQQAATDEFIVPTIRNGRRSAAMPSFQPRVAGARMFGDTDLAICWPTFECWVALTRRRHDAGDQIPCDFNKHGGGRR